MPTPTSSDKLFKEVSDYLEPEQVNLVKRAFDFSAKAHQGQTRKAGGDYIWHPVAVATILAEARLDVESLLAALLHDVVEDTEFTNENIVQHFGDTVADIVCGVTKLGKLHVRSQQEEQAENFRKMILAMSQDIRVILIKLADRLHNMRTLGVMPLVKRRRIARETLDVYAPISARLGINSICTELEDLGFKAVYPYRYLVLQRSVQKARKNRKFIIDQVTNAILKTLKQDNINAYVDGREKHLYSIYKKMKSKKINFDNILDVFAFRIIVDSADDCYRALGSLHSLYKPLPGRIKDYIAIPKLNGYQSLHSVVFGLSGVHVEVQIRTNQMHEVAEHGIAAHWHYKVLRVDKSVLSPMEVKAQEWVQNLLEIQQSTGSSIDFLENVKMDLFSDVIYVFTLQGDIITLPRGATALDFAYAIHSDLGHSAVYCLIDRKERRLSAVLQNGQMIEIIKGLELRPNPAWLNFVVSAKSRSQIHHFLRNQEQDSARKLGVRLLSKALNLYSLSYDSINKTKRKDTLSLLNLQSWDDLMEEIGRGTRISTLVAQQINDLLLNSEKKELPRLTKTSPLAIAGTEGVAVNFAHCCFPIPGDTIIGFMSTGKGLVIHRDCCKNLVKTKKQVGKWLDVVWEKNIDKIFSVSIQVEACNQRGVMALLANIISEAQGDIAGVRTEDRDDKYSWIYITVGVHDRTHLADIMRRLKSMSIVEKIIRLSC